MACVKIVWKVITNGFKKLEHKKQKNNNENTWANWSLENRKNVKKVLQQTIFLEWCSNYTLESQVYLPPVA